MSRNRAARPEARPLRLFVAVDVPEEVREALAEAVASIRARHPRAKWTPAANWHVTLKFLGSTWPRLVSWVGEETRGVAGSHEPFESSIEELGTFPGGARRARVLWARLSDPEKRLKAIAEELESRMAEHFKPEKRNFAPHLTVARFEPPADLGQEPARVQVPSGAFAIDRLKLYRSHLRRPAPVYEVVEEFRLGQ